MDRTIKPDTLKHELDALHAKGLKARFIEGGIEGWKAAGGRVIGQ